MGRLTGAQHLLSPGKPAGCPQSGTQSAYWGGGDPVLSGLRRGVNDPAIQWRRPTLRRGVNPGREANLTSPIHCQLTHWRLRANQEALDAAWAFVELDPEVAGIWHTSLRRSISVQTPASLYHMGNDEKRTFQPKSQKLSINYISE
jgi:hypothetical protein